ncbi:aminoglycoside phosphotransferase [Legionella donaldsonii]|uniref:Aminoglycoside phosphotransferase n=1 Tax=Legionella donaldsonii TaxID=45060 RepID=A0A378J902_9GAMM|nr:phosphotransferase [Legionella donaldsonii]STX44283.1 aminoglycoside phosphotransferase [Legionella donaldsonii]
MDNEHWSSLYFTQPILSITPLTGGLQHQVDLIELADRSKWIAKKFSLPTWLGAITRQRLEFTQAIATIAANQLGLTFSARHTEANDCLLTVDGHFALILPYCEGSVLEAVDSKQAYLLGNRLAQLHLLPLPGDGAERFPPIVPPEGWAHLPWLGELINHCNRYRDYDSQNWVVSHRDIHVNNIIWRDRETPHVIDWESAGYIHPFVELIGLAVNCAGMANSVFATEQFQATLLGYAECAGHLPGMDAILWQQTLHSWLLWLTYCLERGWEKEAWQTIKVIEFIADSMENMQQLYAGLYLKFKK